MSPDRTRQPETMPPLTRELQPTALHHTPGKDTLEVLERTGVSGLCKMVIVWPAGFASVDSREAALLMAEMLREGAEGLTGEEINDEIEFNAAWVNAQFDPISFTIVVHALTRTADKVFPLIERIVRTATFPAEALEGIRAKKIATLRLQNGKVAVRSKNLAMERLFGEDHPLGRHSTEEGYRAVTDGNLRDLHRRVLATPCKIYLAGEITPTVLCEAEKIADNLNGNLIPGEPLVNHIKPKAFTGGQLLEVDRVGDSLQTAVTILIPTISQHHPDFTDLRLACIALGGYFGSRLMSNLREQNGFTYGVSARIINPPKESYISITFECDNRYAPQALEQTAAEIERLAAEPMPPEELANVKSSFLTSLNLLADSAFDTLDFHIIAGLKQLPDDFFKRQWQRIEACTAEDIRRCAEKYLKDAPKITVLSGNPPELKLQ